MKIPEIVRINGIDYPVVYIPNLNNGVNIAYGHIDFEKCQIELNPAEHINHQHRCITLIHEILHGIVHASGTEVENEEKVVDIFAKGLYQVLQDNAAGFFDLERCVEHE